MSKLKALTVLVAVVATVVGIGMTQADSEQPGDVIWVNEIGRATGNCGILPVLDSEALYTVFGTKLYKLSKTTGETLWFKDWDIWMFQPTLVDGSIYAVGSAVGNRFGDSADNYSVISVDASSGELNWEYPVGKYIRGPVAYHDGSVFVTGVQRDLDRRAEYVFLLSLDASTGKRNWWHKEAGTFVSAPVEHEGKIYLGTTADGLTSVDAETGVPYENYHFEGGVIYTPVFNGDTAYVPASWGPIHSINVRTADLNWSHYPDNSTASVHDSPVLSEGILYYRGYDLEETKHLSVNAIDAATGEPKWKYESEGVRYEDILQDLTVYGSAVYISTDGGLLTLDAVTGDLIRQADHGEMCAPLAAEDNILYGRSYDRGAKVFAIRGEGPSS